MSFYTNTVLTSVSDFDINNLVFDKAQVGSIPNSTISFKRINIGVRNPDGTIGECIIPTETVFSYGVQENKDMATGKVNGYVMPLCLWSRSGPTEGEIAFIELIDNITERIKEYLVSDEGKEQTEKYDLEMSDLKKFTTLYRKRDKGKLVDGVGPTLYTKLIHSKKEDRIMSLFYDANDNDLDPMELKGKYCDVNASIKIESIFIGNKVSLQVKLNEAEVKIKQVGMQKLLRSKPKIIKAEDFSAEESDDDNEVENEIEVSDDDEIQDATNEEEEDEDDEKPKKRTYRRKK